MNDLRIHCMLIDDDTDDHEVFQLCLYKLEQAVDLLTMSSCPEALNLLRERPNYTPDYIFLDVNMPLINGLDCLRELRAIRRLDNTPIYMYSTTTQPLVEKRARDLGATGFIVKPARTTELVVQLEEILSGKRTGKG